MRCSKAILPVVILQPDVVRLFGKSSAAFLSQLNYWIQKNRSGVFHKGKRWVFNTAEEWGNQLGVSDRQIRRIVAELKKAGIIFVEKLADYKSNRTNYYTINYERLNELLEERQTDLEASSRSGSSGQNVLMVKTEITNKENNKSDTLKDSYIAVSGTSNNQTKQVKKFTQENGQNKTSESTKNTTIQEMISFWNQIFPNEKVTLNRDLAPLLLSAFKVKFKSDMFQWKHYCKTIESSQYLTGKSFKLSIYWVLKYQTIDRIRAGEFGVKNVPIPGEQQMLEKEFQVQIMHLSEPEKCKEVRLKILKLYGAYVYKHWFHPLKFFIVEDRISFSAPSQFHGDYVAREYRCILGG
ncbi:MAG: hypothetical protein K0M45_03285 [Candidatus Paracaedibacteraceae bacterium]|nr:hypothetical protein [Candidatus Paracaedibacteraceae bacterium]